MKVLVTGGAGFIGSHTVLALHEAGHQTVVVDNLGNGHRDAVLAGEFHALDIRDTPALARLMASSGVEAVIHFAAFIEAGASVSDPLRFYDNNVGGSLSLLQAMRQSGLGQLVFSSTAAIFGTPQSLPIVEDAPKVPTNPYGQSKLMVEHLLADCEAAFGLRAVCLRYFNAAGADPDGRLGERHDPETHLIPLALAAALGQGPPLTLFGDDYPTPDGTCLRDYVHVTDLAAAHVCALAHLGSGGASRAFNIGTGQGFSVREVIAAVEAVTGRTVPYALGPRRPGDPAALVASNARAISELGWSPRFTALHDMVAHAFAVSPATPPASAPNGLSEAGGGVLAVGSTDAPGPR